ncbi:protein kinase sch9 [Phaffia rhodozyma]|uniref:Protein kinase sch9 n=1 Tax=Phaffia rhodozyma TaxID=264483 RepID=A0A0F7SGV1_PHARH|nr:protein kinase sch9 [Phaffia rhodozyma]
MLKFWPSGPSDQVTPKASAQPQVNPFEQMVPSPATAVPSQGQQHQVQLQHSHPPSLLRTPTATEFAVPRGNPAKSGTTTAPPTTSLSIHPPDFRTATPPLRRMPTTPQPASPKSNLAPPFHTAQFFQGLSLNPSPSATPTAVSFGANTPVSRPPSPGSHPRGRLTIKLMEGRRLNIPPEGEATANPYVVLSFEGNDFVSRDPIESHDEPAVKGHPVSTPGAGPPSAGGGLLGMGSISRAFDLAARSRNSSKVKLTLPGGRENGATTPKAGTAGKTEWLTSTPRSSAKDPVWKHEVTFDLVSDQSLLYMTVYDRGQQGEGFLGIRAISTVCRPGFVVDQWFKLEGRSDEQVGKGEVRLIIRYDAAEKTKLHLKPTNFEPLSLIGRGTFGKVYQVRKVDTKRIYAMKVLSKKEIVAKKEVAHTIGERKILQTSLECPFLVGLKFSFQTATQLYFVTDYKSGGELFWHLQKEGRFTEERARFYIAELVLALEHLHRYDIVYRDLKPENILLDATGHIALCDFGLSKPDLASDQLTNTFCGTTEYLAPEVLLDDNGYSKLVDFWSLGVLLFEMCCGWSPFFAEDTQQMYKNICFGKIRFPRGVIDDDGKQFVKGLLNRNPKHRLGATRDAAELKEHAFFKQIDWHALAHKQVTPPFKPVVDSDESVANFDPEFTNTLMSKANPFEDEETGGDFVGFDKAGAPMAIKGLSRPGANPLAGGSLLTSSVQENFRGFTYSGESMMVGSEGVLIKDDQEGEAFEDDEDAVDDDEYDHDEADDDDDDDDEPMVRGVRRKPGEDVDMF